MSRRRGDEAHAVDQAHLTPHNRPRRRRDLDPSPSASPSSSRPSRVRRPPAWIENDGIVTVSTPSKMQPPSHTKVVVEMPRNRSVLASPSKHSFRTAGQQVKGKGQTALYGKGKGKGRVAVAQEQDSSSSSSEEDESSGSDSSSDEGSSSEEEKAIPQTPSRRGRPPKGATPQRTPTKGKLQPGPLTPTSRTARSAGEATPKAKTTSSTSASTPRTHPRPIKRPRLSANGTTSTRSPRSKQAQPAPTSIDYPTTTSKPFVQPTSADFYFAAHTSRRKTSALANTQSWSSSDDKAGGLHSLPALTAKEVAALSRPGSRKDPLSTAGLRSLAMRCYRTQYEQWKSMLFMGNDLLFYGVGSMECVLEDFVRRLVEDDEEDDDEDSTAPPIDAVIIRGRTSMRSEEWISRIEEVLEMPMSSAVLSSDARIARIVQWLSDQGASHLVVLVHSLDTPTLLNPRTRSHMQHLTSSPYVHLLGSTTHPNAHLLDGYVRHPRKRLLWVPCTTLVPMLDDALLSGAGVKLGGLPRQFDLLTGSGGGIKVSLESHDTGASSAASLATQANAPLLTSTSATHVLRSVTTKARALFNLIANELLKQATASPDTPTSWPQRSIPYTRLHNLASRNFLASSESALRALLVEFTSHGLVRVSRDEGVEGEVIGIRIASQQEVKDVLEACKKM